MRVGARRRWRSRLLAVRVSGAARQAVVRKLPHALAARSVTGDAHPVDTRRRQLAASIPADLRGQDAGTLQLYAALFLPPPQSRIPGPPPIPTTDKPPPACRQANFRAFLGPLLGFHFPSTSPKIPGFPNLPLSA